MIFFTSDTHFGHANIIEYSCRPFSSREEMDERLAMYWNGVVGEEDIVYHLGDFTLGNQHYARQYFATLNGIIRVLGNKWHHDSRWLPFSGFYSKSDYQVEILPPMVVLEGSTWTQPVVLSHYPIAEWDRKHYGSWHLHGHSHCKHIARAGDLKMDVGVDCNDYTPVSIHQVVERMREIEQQKSDSRV